MSQQTERQNELADLDMAADSSQDEQRKTVIRFEGHPRGTTSPKKLGFWQRFYAWFSSGFGERVQLADELAQRADELAQRSAQAEQQIRQLANTGTRLTELQRQLAAGFENLSESEMRRLSLEARFKARAERLTVLEHRLNEALARVDVWVSELPDQKVADADAGAGKRWAANIEAPNLMTRAAKVKMKALELVIELDEIENQWRFGRESGEPPRPPLASRVERPDATSGQRGSVEAAQLQGSQERMLSVVADGQPGPKSRPPTPSPETPPLRFLIDPGEAAPEEIGELLAEVSHLYRLMGGSGIQFTPAEPRAPDETEVCA